MTPGLIKPQQWAINGGNDSIVQRRCAMFLAAYAKTFLVGLWRAVLSWLQLGQRLERFERDLKDEAARTNLEIEHLRRDLVEVKGFERESLSEVRLRLDHLETKQDARFNSLDRALHNRIDEWSRQLTAQINQVYVEVARHSVDVTKR